MSPVSDPEAEGASPVPSDFEEETFSSQYVMLRTIGEGSQAKVMLAKHRFTDAHVAVKVYLKNTMWYKPVLSEVTIMRMVNHPNIISLLQVIESENQIYLIMELANGQDLYEVIARLVPCGRTKPVEYSGKSLVQ